MRRTLHASWPRLLPLLLLVLGLWLLVVGKNAFAFTEGPSAPAPSGSAAGARAAVAPSEVRVREKVVAMLRATLGGRTAQERARASNAVIEALLAQGGDPGEARFEETQGTAVVYIGKAPVLTLGPEDVEAAGEANLKVLAAQVTTRLADAVSTERKRSVIATTVFSVSLLVFAGLLAFLLLGRVSDVTARIRTAMFDDPERITAVRLGNVELLSAGAARGALSIALTLAHRLAQVALAYGWLIFGLSLFDATRDYTERLTGMVVKPLSGLATRIGSSVPLIVVAGIAIVAVSVLVRFVGLFFDSVTRGDTRITWLSRDLAQPTSVLARFAIIVVALVLSSPMITGESDGVISRAGLVALLGVALASTPLLASAAVGVTVVFGRRYRRGEHVEIGSRAGRVVDVTLLHVKLEDDALSEVTVPHLLALVHPTRVNRHALLSSMEVVVDPKAPQETIERALLEAARTLSARARVELLSIDQTGARWRVTSAAVRNELSLAKSVQEALGKLGVALGGKGTT